MIVVALYAESISYDYVYDDVPIVQTDARLEDPSFIVHVWWETWWPLGSPKAESRPLTTFSFWAQRQLFGASPRVPHIINVLIFAALTWLVAVLAGEWLRQPWAAWPAGLIFAVHPIHVEVAANLVGRAESLSACFCAAALLAWLRWRQNLNWPRAMCIAVLVLLAGQSKETGYLTALVLVCAEIAERRCEGRAIWGRPRFVPLIICIAIVGSYAVIQRAIVTAKSLDPLARHVDLVHPANNPLAHATWGERIVTPLKLMGHAALLLIAPYNQSPDYSPQELMPTTNLADPHVLLGSVTVICWTSAVVFFWRSRARSVGPLLACAVAWLVPSNTIIVIGTIFGDRLLTLLSVFMPIAIVGLFVDATADPAYGRQRRQIVCWLILLSMIVYVPIMLGYVFIGEVAQLNPHRSEKMAVSGLLVCFGAWYFLKLTHRTLPVVAVGAAVLAYAWTTSNYVSFWRDLNTLVVSTALRHPNNGRFQGHYAWYLVEQAQRRPDADTAWYAEAERTARRALELLADQADGYRALSRVATYRGDHERAALYDNLARQFGSDRVAQAKAAKAIEELEQRIGSDLSQVTDGELLKQYASALSEYGDVLRLMAVYQRWVELEEKRWDLRVNGALVILAADGDRDTARRWIDEAIQLQPDQPGPWAALSLWYERDGQFSRALEAITKALELMRPEDPRRHKFEATQRQLRQQVGR